MDNSHGVHISIFTVINHGICRTGNDVEVFR